MQTIEALSCTGKQETAPVRGSPPGTVSYRAPHRELVVIPALVLLCGGLFSACSGGSSDAGRPGAAAGTANSAPTISGSPPAQVTAGQRYSFTPSASDPDGDRLSFSASNLPSWATLDSGNGNISGTPSAADVGTYGGISISVSDGTDTVRLDPFTVDVLARGANSGAVVLSWTAPTENEDGSPLTDLAGYRLYWAREPGVPGVYPNTVTIDNPGVTIYVVEDLAPGTYEFVATAFNASGAESRFSNPTTKTVP